MYTKKGNSRFYQKNVIYDHDVHKLTPNVLKTKNNEILQTFSKYLDRQFRAKYFIKSKKKKTSIIGRGHKT